MGIPTMKQLLEAGVHFGHQTRRWDPRMKPYIFTERNGIHIIDLQQTMTAIKIVYNFVRNLTEEGKSVLFVGTKRQAQAAIAAQAERCGMFYINQRWMGGTLTNFSTIKKSIQRLKQMEEQKESGDLRLLPKKEQLSIEKQILKLNRSLGGIKEMKALPGAVFIVDPRREAIAIAEARKLKIPVIALADTNCNPEPIDYIIPGNDDAIRAINLITTMVADACLLGKRAAKDAETAPDISEEEEPFAPTEEELTAFEDYEDEFEEEEEEEVLRKKKIAARKKAIDEEEEEEAEDVLL
ncbi:MAG: 30S ribosomal protein S2 [Candidatus Hydrogenedentota bacterium]|nr:MAG: 30S ribosomal protein S2 [Candidatus Hydrogenedentota bacterium]